MRIGGGLRCRDHVPHFSIIGSVSSASASRELVSKLDLRETGCEDEGMDGTNTG